MIATALMRPFFEMGRPVCASVCVSAWKEKAFKNKTKCFRQMADSCEGIRAMSERKAKGGNLKREEV